jgi:hypothetical protein
VAAADELGAGSLIVAAPPSRTSVAWATLPAVSPLTDLDAFFTDHRRCGELDAGVDGLLVWFDCECGARIARPRRWLGLGGGCGYDSRRVKARAAAGR